MYYCQDFKKILLEKFTKYFHKQDILQNHVMKIKNVKTEQQGHTALEVCGF